MILNHFSNRSVPSSIQTNACKICGEKIGSYLQSRWGILGGKGGDWCFDKILILKCICLVFHGENGQNEYILIIFSFTNIV